MDTSVLTMAAAPGTTLMDALESRARLESHGEPVLVPQCLYEFYAVATRPRESRGGLALAPTRAIDLMAKFGAGIELLPEPTDLMEEWIRLVGAHSVVGRAAHDARLAAFAFGHGIGTVATRDRGGFARFGLGEVEP